MRVNTKGVCIKQKVISSLGVLDSHITETGMRPGETASRPRGEDVSSPLGRAYAYAVGATSSTSSRYSGQLKVITPSAVSSKQPTSLKYGLLNARSVNNKTESVVDFMLEHKLQILCITETWLNIDHSFTTNNVTPNGFNIVSSPRLNKRGVSVAVIIDKDIQYKRLANVCFSTFEVLLLHVTSFAKSFAITTIYRTPGPPGNFFNEFSDLISTLVAKYDDFMLAGDFNIHVDIAADESSKKLATLLEIFNMRQHVNFPTHAGGHILDLVITKVDSQLIKDLSMAEGISDHQGILVHLGMAIQNRKVIKKTYHQFKKVDMVKFQQDIVSSELYTNPSSDVDLLATQYHNVISNLVSIHAPAITRVVTSRSPAPWYSPEIALARKKRRQLEKKWRHSKLTVDREIFVAQKSLVNGMIADAKAKYYTNLAKTQSSNPRQLWATINSLSGHVKPKILPDHENLSSLVNDFNLFFTNKVTQLRSSMGMPGKTVESSFEMILNVSHWSVFQETNEVDVFNLIKCSPSKRCCMDPVPTYFLKNVKPLFLH